MRALAGGGSGAVAVGLQYGAATAAAGGDGGLPGTAPMQIGFHSGDGKLYEGRPYSTTVLGAWGGVGRTVAGVGLFPPGTTTSSSWLLVMTVGAECVLERTLAEAPDPAAIRCPAGAAGGGTEVGVNLGEAPFEYPFAAGLPGAVSPAAILADLRREEQALKARLAELQADAELLTAGESIAGWDDARLVAVGEKVAGWGEAVAEARAARRLAAVAGLGGTRANLDAVTAVGLTLVPGGTVGPSGGVQVTPAVGVTPLPMLRRAPAVDAPVALAADRVFVVTGAPDDAGAEHRTLPLPSLLAALPTLAGFSAVTTSLYAPSVDATVSAECVAVLVPAPIPGAPAQHLLLRVAHGGGAGGGSDAVLVLAGTPDGSTSAIVTPTSGAVTMSLLATNALKPALVVEVPLTAAAAPRPSPFAAAVAGPGGGVTYVRDATRPVRCVMLHVAARRHWLPPT